MRVKSAPAAVNCRLSASPAQPEPLPSREVDHEACRPDCVGPHTGRLPAWPKIVTRTAIRTATTSKRRCRGHTPHGRRRCRNRRRWVSAPRKRLRTSSPRSKPISSARMNTPTGSPGSPPTSSPTTPNGSPPRCPPSSARWRSPAPKRPRPSTASTVDPVTPAQARAPEEGLSLPPPDRPGAAEELANIEIEARTRPTRPPRSGIRARSSPSTTSRTSCAPRAIRTSSRRSGRAGTPIARPMRDDYARMVEPRERRRARARLRRDRRAVALLVRHAARRIRPNGRAPVVAARADVPEPAMLRPRPPERKIRRRGAAAQRADPRRPARRHVGAELEQRLRPPGAEERRRSATT